MHLNLNLSKNILSSFWLWFAASLTIAQIFLLYMVLFVLMKPPAETLGQTMGALYNAIAQIEKLEGPTGTKQYIESISSLDHVKIVNSLPDEHHPGVWFPAFRAFEKSLANHNGDLRVVYSKEPRPSAYFFKPSSPETIFGISLSEPTFARRYLIVSILTTLIITALAAYWISSRLAGPLSSLSKQATKMADESKVKNIVLSKNASPEIVSLANALNHMKSEIDRSISEREQFLAMVSHDLRTPLSRMALWLDLGGSNSEEVSKHLHSDIEEMRSFIEQFVELTKLNSEIHEPWEFGNLGSILEELVERYNRAGSKISLKIDGQLDIRFKPIALSRLLYNLTDNAIRYGTGSVDIVATRKDDGIHLVISNQVSIHRNVLGVVDAFKAADEPQPEVHGAGLGLKIVKQFAEVHGARIIDTSTDTSRGITIVFNS